MVNTWSRPSYQPRLAPLPVPQSQIPPNAMIANTTSVPSSAWFPDSGASYHVTNASQNIQQTTPFEGPDQIFIGNGQGLHIHSSGSSYFPSHSKPNTLLALHNLLLVPSITKNLISVSKFCLDNRVFFEFHADMCYVKSQATNEILLQDRVGSDGLYQFSQLQLLKSPSTSQVSCLTLDSKMLLFQDLIPALVIRFQFLIKIYQLITHIILNILGIYALVIQILIL